MLRGTFFAALAGFSALLLPHCGAPDRVARRQAPAPAAASPLSANIDGVPWASDPIPDGAGVFLVVPGSYFIEGERSLTTSNREFVVLSLSRIEGPGSYPLGVETSTAGGGGRVGDASGGWGTALSESAGTVTITTLTATRIAGTFSFAAEPVSGAAAGTRRVTDGRFDFPIVRSNRLGASTGPRPLELRLRDARS